VTRIDGWDLRPAEFTTSTRYSWGLPVSAVLSMNRMVGGSLGVAVSGALFQHVFATRVAEQTAGTSLERFPSGQMIMNKDDHQGRTTYYLLKINGQKEEIAQTFAADSLPLIGDCKIAG